MSAISLAFHQFFLSLHQHNTKLKIMKKHIVTTLLSCMMAVSCFAQHGWAAMESITLDECPTSYGKYSAKPVIKDYALVKVEIFFNGSLMQEIYPPADETSLVMPVYEETADKLIHFPDANNDGYRDIFVGYGGSRTNNALFLFNPKVNKFVRCKSADGLQGVVFCPQEGAVYNGGSNSAWEYSITRYEWKGMVLNETAELNITNNIDDYNKNAMGSYHKTYPYVLMQRNGKIKRARKVTELPIKWQRIIKRLLP